MEDESLFGSHFDEHDFFVLTGVAESHSEQAADIFFEIDLVSAAAGEELLSQSEIVITTAPTRDRDTGPPPPTLPAAYVFQELVEGRTELTIVRGSVRPEAQLMKGKTWICLDVDPSEEWTETVGLFQASNSSSMSEFRARISKASSNMRGSRFVKLQDLRSYKNCEPPKWKEFIVVEKKESSSSREQKKIAGETKKKEKNVAKKRDDEKEELEGPSRNKRLRNDVEGLARIVVTIRDNSEESIDASLTAEEFAKIKDLLHTFGKGDIAYWTRKLVKGEQMYGGQVVALIITEGGLRACLRPPVGAKVFAWTVVANTTGFQKGPMPVVQANPDGLVLDRESTVLVVYMGHVSVQVDAAVKAGDFLYGGRLDFKTGVAYNEKSDGTHRMGVALTSCDEDGFAVGLIWVTQGGDGDNSAQLATINQEFGELRVQFGDVTEHISSKIVSLDAIQASLVERMDHLDARLTEVERLVTLRPGGVEYQYLNVEEAVGFLKSSHMALEMDFIDGGQAPLHLRSRDISSLWVPLRFFVCGRNNAAHEKMDALRKGRTNQHLSSSAVRTPIELEDFFRDRGGLSNRVVVQGRPGSGKSTALQYICQQWADGKLWSDLFDAVVLIPLIRVKEVLNRNSGADWLFILKELLTPLGINAALFWPWAARNKRVLWVFDGVDEVSAVSKSNAVLSRLLGDRSFLVNVIFSSRPEALRDIKANLLVEIGTLSPEDSVKYVKTFFEDDEQKFAHISSWISDSSSVMHEWMHTPMNLELVCCYAAEDPDASRLTDVYGCVLKKMLRRSREKVKVGSLSDCLLSDTKVLQVLAFVAWNGLANDRGVCDVDVVENAIEEVGGRTLSPEQQRNSARFIFDCGPFRVLGDEYFWLHYSLQEYLAATYLCDSMADEEVERVLFDASSCYVTANGRSDLFYMFVAGLAGEFGRKNTDIILKCISRAMVARLGSFKNNIGLATSVCSSIIEWFLEDSSGTLKKNLSSDDSGLSKEGLDVLCSCAARYGEQEFVRALLIKGADPRKAICGAVQGQCREIIELLLKKGAHADGAMDHAPNVGMFKFLLDNGADADAGIECAVLNDDKESLSLLIAYGADIFEALEKAVSCREIELVLFLLEHEDMNDPTCGLLTAIEDENEALVEYFLEMGNCDLARGIEKAVSAGVKFVELLLDFEANADEGMPFAIHAGDVEVVQLLIDKGADADDAMEEAVLRENVEIILLLIEEGACSTDALYHASVHNKLEIISLLMNEFIDADPHLALVAAIQAENLATLELLLDRGAKTNDAVVLAAKEGYVEGVLFLLENKNGSADIAMAGAAFCGSVELVNLLLSKKKVNPNVGIATAAGVGNLEIVELLLKAGADVNRGLISACNSGMLQLVEMLLGRGASPNAGIYAAALKGHFSIVELLLQKGADPNLALKAATKNGHEDLITLLVEKYSAVAN